MVFFAVTLNAGVENPLLVAKHFRGGQFHRSNFFVTSKDHYAICIEYYAFLDPSTIIITANCGGMGGT